MRKIMIICAIVAISLISNYAFAGCGMCGVGAAPEQGVVQGTFKGEVICLGCTLKKEKGAKAQCSAYGHKNALRTADGSIWTFLENDASAKLIDSHE